MLRAIRSVAAEHSSGGAIFFTAPADAFGVFGFERKAHFFLFHRKSIAERWAVILIDIGFYNAVRGGAISIGGNIIALAGYLCG